MVLRRKLVETPWLLRHMLWRISQETRKKNGSIMGKAQAKGIQRTTMNSRSSALVATILVIEQQIVKNNHRTSRD